MAEEKTFKPKQPPTSFSASALDNAVRDLYVKVFGKQPPTGREHCRLEAVRGV
jgi:hypothetical protein